MCCFLCPDVENYAIMWEKYIHIFLTHPFFNEKEGYTERETEKLKGREKEREESLFIATRPTDQSRVMRPSNGGCFYCISGTWVKESKSCSGSKIFCLSYLYPTALLFLLSSSLIEEFNCH